MPQPRALKRILAPVPWRAPAVTGRECVQIFLLPSLSGSQPGNFLGGQLGACLAKGDGRGLQPPDLKWTTGRRASPRRLPQEARAGNIGIKTRVCGDSAVRTTAQKMGLPGQVKTK